ncbi:VaFE repeat-containing surface-anchored protein, partial [Corynebacterium accolens]|uniref:VaFE repeat-containing surface-anchored protein n=1 Tax=Corynebacterium accolens TaxID=38284 RepID=UPI0025436181
TEVNDKGEDTPDVEKPNKVAEHKDITDKDQTVTSKGSKKGPKISTNADFAEGSHEVIAGAEIIDTVSYEGLVPGKEYTLSAELISKEDGTTVLGKGEKTFTPAAANGTEDVTITVNDDVTEPVEAAVAFEELTSTEVNDKGEDTPDAEKPNKVAEHKEIDDKDQTVTSEECDNPGDKPNKGKIPWWAILIPGIGLGKIIHDHRHEGDHDQPKDHHKDHPKGSSEDEQNGESEQQSKGNGDNHTPGKTDEDQPGEAGQSVQDHVPGKTGTPLPADAGRTEIKSVPSGATELDPGVQGYIK